MNGGPGRSHASRPGEAAPASRGFSAALLAGAILLALGMAYYYYGVLIPLREHQYGACEPRGNWSDLYPRWLGSRELLLRGRNPYSAEVTKEIQRGFYGCVLGTPQQPRDQEGFAYPAYAVFLFAPLLKLDFHTVHLVFGTFMIGLTAGSLLLWMRVVGVPPSARNAVLCLVLGMCSFPVLDGIHLQQVTLLVAALISLSLAALRRGRLLAAGLLLALAAIKPQLVLGLAAWLLLWTVAEWRKRKAFALGFFATLFLLAGAAEFVLPGWLGMWRHAASDYLGYVRPSLFASVFGTGEKFAGALVVLFATAVAWLVRRAEAGTDEFNLALIVSLLLPTCFVPNAGVGKYNLVLLVPAALWLFSAGWSLRTRSLAAAITWMVAVNALLWQWLGAAAVSFAVLALGLRIEREATLAGAGPQAIVFIFPLALLPFVAVAAAQVYRKRRAAAA